MVNFMITSLRRNSASRISGTKREERSRMRKILEIQMTTHMMRISSASSGKRLRRTATLNFPMSQMKMV